MKDRTDFTADTTALANLVADGLATEADNGLALRTIQTKLGVNLIATLQETNNGFQSLNKLLQLCIEKYTTNLTAMLNAETIQHEELFEIITTLQKNQVAYLELQRKIVQSPTKIFSDDLVSADERKLLALLKSFKTPEEKAQFLKAVDTELNGSQSNEFE